ncbi:MAG TPA: hypothetical protein VKT77_19520 [Chthonomonadaceae bacterium]|nr:hypothetical protein [Chthonomonadaceae bacterium]
MKALGEYSREDWRRLRPLSHAMKTCRYRLVDWAHMRRRARGGDPAAIRAAIHGRRAMVAIAFADPQAIEWQARLVRRYVEGAVYVVADNSPEDAAAGEIETVCARYGVPYLRLPRNPWQEPSRSHGIALNWMWRNVIRPGRPEAFGFLDDDLFPTAPDDPFGRLASQDFYGMIRSAGQRWFLWAGFCFYRFDRVAARPLDFGQDWFKGLDTGGGNWRVLYRHVERGAIDEPPNEHVAFEPGIEVLDGPIQWIGPWLHEVGVLGRKDLAPRKREAIARMLAPHLT